MTFWPFGPWIDGVYWTLGVELSFYALVFILLIFGRFRWLPAAMAIIGMASTIWVALPHQTWLGDRSQELLLLPYGMYFTLGVFFWRATVRGIDPGTFLICAVCLIGGILQILGITDARRVSVGLSPWPPAIIWLVGVAFLAFSIRHEHAISRWTGPFAPTLALVGLATYPLYLLHQVIGSALIKGLALMGMGRFLALAISMLAMVALALVVTIFPERQLKKAIGSRLRLSDRPRH